MTVSDIFVRKIFDSRGDSTIEIGITNTDKEIFLSQVPSGKSRGIREAVVFDFDASEESVDKLRSELRTRTFGSVHEFDDTLLKLDNTAQKSIFGGNVLIGASVAFTKALAREQSREVWEVVQDEFFRHSRGETRPRIFANVINGGAHAASNLDFQEYQIIADGNKFTELTGTLVNIYRKLGEKLKKSRGLKALPLGDEDGYTLDFSDNFEPIGILEQLLDEMFPNDMRLFLGIDAAASHFCHNGVYTLEGKNLTTEELYNTYQDYFIKSKRLQAVEDPFEETDLAGFKLLQEKAMDKIIIGDDLTVTNPNLINKFAEAGCIGGVIIKPNQIGTVSESCRAILAAREHGLKVIISHRSGSTKNPFIIHLARASGADGVKIGVPVHERVTRFNELIRLYNS